MAGKFDSIDKLYDYDISYRDKSIFLWTDQIIDADISAKFCKGLMALDKTRPELPIKIYLNSVGGNTSQGLAIYDMIRQCESEVYIYVYGDCLSVAAWILQAGDKRYMSKRSKLMVHIGDESYEDNHPKNIRAWIRYRDKQEEPIFEDILLERIRENKPKFTRKQLQDLLLFDKIFTPEKALEYNLTDYIIPEE